MAPKANRLRTDREFLGTARMASRSGSVRCKFGPQRRDDLTKVVDFQDQQRPKSVEHNLNLAVFHDI